jgi:hypothetical protein
MFGFNMGGKHEFLLNTLIFISKWFIWKARNKVKYDKIHINQTLLYNIWKQTLKSELFIKIVMFDINRNYSAILATLPITSQVVSRNSS